MPGARPAPPARPRPRLLTALAMLAALLCCALPGASGAAAATYVPISGAGSTWSQNALDQWRANVKQYGMTVNYNGTGSSDGRNQFRNGTVDFAVSEIPYGVKDSGVVDPPPSRKYAYMPIVAGGTSFMYNLTIGGRRVTNLRLSGDTLTKMFTGVVKTWNDPAIKADNPALAALLPARRVVPVVRSDGSGTTAQFTAWMADQHADLWNAYCGRAGRDTPCGTTSNYPLVPGSGFVAQSGSNGVSGYVAQRGNVGTITYVEYSYAVYTTGFPVAKILNKAGYYTEPTATNVAVALTEAQINENPSSPQYLTQILKGVYEYKDPRTYPLSSYSYMIIPTALESNFNQQKGKTLGAFAYYFLCQGQQHVDDLGYSPLPVNLVKAGLAQIRRVPGVSVENTDIRGCHNPTFSTDGSNTLARTAPYPQPCDRAGTTQCATGTGGNKTPTVVGSNSTSGGGSSGGASGGNGTAGAGGGNGTASTSGAATAGTTGKTGAAGGTDSNGTDAHASTSVDPDTGQVVNGTGGTSGGADAGGDGAFPVPVTTSSSIDGGTQHALMALAAVLLVVVTLGPPLLTQRLRRKKP